MALEDEWERDDWYRSRSVPATPLPLMTPRDRELPIAQQREELAKVRELLR
jgi:hypothetical protein